MMQGVADRLLREGPVFWGMERQLAATEFASLDQLRDVQSRRLRELVAYAYRRVPYYRAKFDAIGLLPGDIRGVEDLPKIPLLTKTDLAERFHSLRARGGGAVLVREARTSGTTGSPVRVLRDLPSINFENAAVWRQWRWAGVQPGDWVAVCRGDPPVAGEEPPLRRIDAARHRLCLSPRHLRPEWIPLCLEAMAARKVRALQAYPSAALALAQGLAAMGKTLPLAAVFTSSEPLHAHHRAAMEAAFRCRVWDFYGMGERVAAAAVCEARHGLHLHEEYGILELVDRDGNPAAREGLVVGTGLHNRAMPLLRYVVGDPARLLSGSCSCGRHSRRIAPIEGRLMDRLFFPGGQILSPAALTRPFQQADHIRKSRIVQTAPHRLEVRVVPASPAFRGEPLARELEQILEGRMRVAVRVVSELPAESSGKYRWVVSELHG